MKFNIFNMLLIILIQLCSSLINTEYQHTEHSISTLHFVVNIQTCINRSPLG